MTDSSRRYEGIRLKMLTFGGASYHAALQVLAGEFEQETGATIEFVAPPYPYGWWYLEPMAEADATSGHPTLDLFCDDREWQFLLHPYLLELGPLIEASEYDMEGFLRPVYQYDEGVAGYPGVRYGLPLRIRGTYVFYRTDLIEEFPSSWDGYERVLEDCTRDGLHGLGVEGSVYPYHPFGDAHELTKLFLARYASLEGRLLTSDWEPCLADDRAVEALTMLIRQMEAFAPADVLAWDSRRAAEAFLRGEVAVVECGGGHILPYAQDATKSDIVNRWSIGLYPGGGGAPYTLHNISIFKHSRHPEAAFAFIAFCTGERGATRLQLEFSEDSARRTVLTRPEMHARNPSVHCRAEALDRAVPSVPGTRQVYEMIFVLWEAVQLSIQGRVPVRYALDRAARKWEALLEKDPPDWKPRL